MWGAEGHRERPSRLEPPGKSVDREYGIWDSPGPVDNQVLWFSYVSSDPVGKITRLEDAPSRFILEPKKCWKIRGKRWKIRRRSVAPRTIGGRRAS